MRQTEKTIHIHGKSMFVRLISGKRSRVEVKNSTKQIVRCVDETFYGYKVCSWPLKKSAFSEFSIIYMVQVVTPCVFVSWLVTFRRNEHCASRPWDGTGSHSVIKEQNSIPPLPPKPDNPNLITNDFTLRPPTLLRLLQRSNVV
jgi:hypothetical protein